MEELLKKLGKMNYYVKNIDEIRYYISLCEQHNLSQRQLHDRIKNHEYDRLSDETKDKLIKEEQLKH